MPQLGRLGRNLRDQLRLYQAFAKITIGTGGAMATVATFRRRYAPIRYRIRRNGII